jgi:Ca2+-binding EF-hand superfamily protein
MKISKVLIIVAVLIIAAYFVLKGMNRGSESSAAKPRWFSKVDTNQDGKISPEELKAIDTNGDGKISPEEAKAYEIPEGDFKTMDVNGDGYLTQDEMKTYGG